MFYSASFVYFNHTSCIDMNPVDISVSMDTGSPVPLYEQLYRHIVREITSGRLASGARLPSRRRLSQHLGISQMTVDSAYELLKAEGYLRSEARRGLFVEQLSPLQKPEIARQPALPQARLPIMPAYDFSPQATDLDLFPYQPWIRLIKETLLREPEVLNRGHARGEPSLREALAEFLYQYRGVFCHAEDMVIGYSVENLLGVVASLMEKPGTLAVEDPGYPAAGRAFERKGFSISAIPLDEQGIHFDALKASQATLVYTTPAHQYPMGISMPAPRRSELLHWASEKAERYVIEDDYDSEFRYATRPLPALHSMGNGHKVIYISTFSRTLAPGIRMAYMVLPPPLSKAYDRLRLRAGDSVSRFEQRAMARLIQEGHYVRHLRRAAGIYQKRCETLSALLSDIQNSWLSGQEAGLHFIFGIAGRTEQDLIQKAIKANIPLQGLSPLTSNAPCPGGLVLGFAGLKDHQLQEAVSALRAAWGV